LDFADVKVPNTAFKRVVRDLAFDVAELAIVTFLMARARGVPLTLLPAVVLARFQHPYLVYDASRGTMAPGDLAGRRIGLRSYTVTTAAWVRAILAHDCGVDLASIRWVTFEEAHVAGFTDPPGVERAPPGHDLLAMLRAGEIDAAIVGAPVEDPRIRTVIADPAAAAEAWRTKYGAIQLNHLVAVKSALCESSPDAVREVYRLLGESKRAAGLPQPGAVDLNPFGIEANRRNLQMAIAMAFEQGLIPRRLGVDELFDGVAREFS
jgi:4,5-dihydroxyphthalate decarboxylase